MFSLKETGHLHPLLGEGLVPVRRQDLPSVYVINGALYVARVDWLQQHRTFLAPETVGYVMLADRSLDLDSEDDFELLRMRLQGDHGQA
jgi:N-acylneuraminate cytidylyltransferase